MRDFDAQPADAQPDGGLDEWLADQHRELVRDLGSALDLEAGLSEVLISASHADLLVDLDRSLDVDAGLVAVLRADPKIARPGWVRHRFAVAAVFIALAAIAAAIVPVWSATHKAQPGSPANVACVANATPSNAPPPVAPAPSTNPNAGLDVLYYKAYGPRPTSAASCAGTGTVQFRVAVTARGSGTVHITWLRGGPPSSQPVGSAILTFTGPAQTQTVTHTVPLACDKDQQVRVRMTAELTEPAVPIGSSADYYDATCR